MIEFVHQRGLVSANDDGNGLKKKKKKKKKKKQKMEREGPGHARLHRPWKDKSPTTIRFYHHHSCCSAPK